MSGTETPQTPPPPRVDAAQTAAPTLGALGFLVLLAGPFLANLDLFITNVALPTINSDLHTSSGALELIVAGYGTAYAVLLVLGGRLGDNLGRRRIFAYGLLGFTLTSLLAGLAPNALVLILARALQGASAALLTPQVLATFQATLQGEARGRAISRYAAAGGLAAVVGQLLGGLLLHWNIGGSSWRSVFLINVPVGVAALLLLRRSVPETRSSEPGSVDVAGTALLALAIIALLVPLTQGPALGWPWWVFAVLAASVGAAYTLVRVERRQEQAGRLPLLPPSLLALASVGRGLPVTALYFTGFGAFMFVFALSVQNGLHVGALASGVAITPTVLAYFLTTFAVPGLLRRFGRGLLGIAMLLQGTGLVTLTVLASLTWPHVSLLVATPELMLLGVGQALAVGSIFRLVLSEVPPRLAGVGSGAMVTVQNAALALGVASLGTLYSVMALHGVVLAFQVAAAAQLALSVLIGLISRTLPQPVR